MSSMPESVRFGDPNAYPTNFPQLYNNEQNGQSNEKQNGEKQTKDSSSEKTDQINGFLNKKATTILTFAIAVAIGLGIKDFLNSIVMSVLQPLVITIILTLDKNDYLPMTASLREKNVQVDISKFLGSLLVLKLVIGFTYLMYIYSGIFDPLKLI